MLGRVAHGANNHIVYESDQFGKQVARTFRDSVSAPLFNKKRKLESSRPKNDVSEAIGDSPASSSHEQVVPKVADTIATSTSMLYSNYNGTAVGDHSSSVSVHSASKMRARFHRDEEARLVRRRVDDVGSSLVPASGQLSATERTQALLQRVRLKQADSSTT